MTSEAGLLARLTRLTSEMQGETAALERLERELSEIRSSWPEAGVPSRPTLIVAAVDLHGYYTALDVLLERVARAVDEELPTGPSWHSELLSQMALEIPSLRPPVIPASVIPELHELRRFRHFFRNAYTLDPDPARLIEHIGRVLRVHPSIAATIEGLRAHLEATVRKLVAPPGG